MESCDSSNKTGAEYHPEARRESSAGSGGRKSAKRMVSSRIILRYHLCPGHGLGGASHEASNSSRRASTRTPGVRDDGTLPKIIRGAEYGRLSSFFGPQPHKKGSDPAKLHALATKSCAASERSNTITSTIVNGPKQRGGSSTLVCSRRRFARTSEPASSYSTFQRRKREKRISRNWKTP